MSWGGRKQLSQKAELDSPWDQALSVQDRLDPVCGGRQPGTVPAPLSCEGDGGPSPAGGGGPPRRSKTCPDQRRGPRGGL